MPERGRQQAETRQSQAMLPSPREGAASVEGRALWHRGDPTGAPRPSAQVGALSPPYPTLTGSVPHPDWGRPGEVGDLARGSAWLPAQPHCRATGSGSRSGKQRRGHVGQQRQRRGGRLAGEQGDGQHPWFPWAGPPPGEGRWCVSPLLGAASRRRGRTMRAAGHGDAGSWPCQTRMGRAERGGHAPCVA